MIDVFVEDMVSGSTSIAEVMEGEENMICPGCNSLIGISRDYSLNQIDSVEIECKCGWSETYSGDLGRSVLPSYMEWYGHKLVWVEDYLKCVNCDFMISKITRDELPEDSEMLFELWAIGRSRKYDCGF